MDIRTIAALVEALNNVCDALDKCDETPLVEMRSHIKKTNDMAMQALQFAEELQKDGGRA